MLQHHFRFLGQRPLKALLAGGALAGLGVLAPGAIAASANVAGPANLGATVSIPVQAGDVWNLSGSGIYLANPITLPVGTLAISGDGVNSLTLNGGGAYGRFVDSAIGAYTLNLHNITLTGASQQNVDGGTISIANTNVANTLTINASGAVTFSNNSLFANSTQLTRGGAIYVYRALTINGDGNGGAITFTGNRAGIGISGTTSPGGGAIYAGAPILIGDAKSVVTLSDNAMEHVTSTVTSGGAIGAGSAVTIRGSAITISGNSAAGTGGAIDAGASATGVAIGNADGSSGTVQITGNQSYNNAGGAMYVLSTPETPATPTAPSKPAVNSPVAVSGQNVTISGNTSLLSGGAIWTNMPDAGLLGVKIDGGQIALDDNHSATAQGGAIYAFSNVEIGNAGSTTVTLNGNSAATRGGAIYTNGALVIGHADSSAVTLDGNSISGSASGWGGALYVDTVAISGKTIKLTNNSATTSGGGVYAASGVTIGNAAGDSAVTLSGNSATYGGAVYSKATATTAITGSTVTIAGNSASNYGGAIAAFGDLTVTGAASFTGNKAATVGGAIMADANLALNATTGNITFSGNQANGQPNAIWFNNSASNAAATFNTAGHAITFSDPIANEAANGPLGVTASGGGAVVFNNGQKSPLYGATVVSSGATFAVQGGASYGALKADLTGATGSGSTFTVSSGATLAGGGSGQVRADSFSLQGDLNIAGGSAASGNVFTVTSPKPTFGPSAKVQINTNLSDASAAQTDKLVVDLAGGALAAGATVKVFVANTGTVARGNDFLLVQVKNAGAATLPADTFTLGASLPGGYELVQGDGANVNNWYLHSATVGQIPVGNATAAVPALDHLALALLAALLLAGAAVGARRKS